MKFIALIEGKDVKVIQWFMTKQKADKFIATWLSENRDIRPYVRTTIAECLFTIEG